MGGLLVFAGGHTKKWGSGGELNHHCMTLISLLKEPICGCLKVLYLIFFHRCGIKFVSSFTISLKQAVYLQKKNLILHVFGGVGNQSKPMQTQGQHDKPHTEGLRRDRISNLGRSRCEVQVLTAAPPCPLQMLKHDFKLISEEKLDDECHRNVRVWARKELFQIFVTLFNF